VAAANREGERIWFVVFAEAERQYEQVGRTEIRDAFTWLETNYGSFEKRSFNDLDVYLYADPIDGIDANCQ
jgi:hypothetical protein